MAHWLSHHVSYACRHAGACCSSGWPIPLERDREPAVARAIASGRIDVAQPWLLPVINQPPDVAGVLRERDGHCVFHQRDRCAIHTALDHDALPSACRHFPRVCLIDDRGVFVTLSHYCPTTAGLALSHQGPIHIVEGPPPVPRGAPEGLDARGAWPPLLVPGVLMDLESYSQWEAHQIAWLGGERNPNGSWLPDEVLRMLHLQARRLSAWRPGDGTLAARIRDLAGQSPDHANRAPDWRDEHRLLEAALASLAPAQAWDGDVVTGDGRWSTTVAEAWRASSAVVNRFLAAHAFAAWSSYHADSLVAQLRHLDVAMAVLRNEVTRVSDRTRGELTSDGLVQALRQADLLLVHLVDRSRLATELTTLTQRG